MKNDLINSGLAWGLKYNNFDILFHCTSKLSYYHYIYSIKSNWHRNKNEWISIDFEHCSPKVHTYLKVHTRLHIVVLRSQWSGWVSIIQKIRIGNFWFRKLLWIQILANIMPLNNSYHFDTFDHNYWEINCLELHIWQFYLVNNFRKKNLNLHMWKKVDPNSCFTCWEGSSWYAKP